MLYELSEEQEKAIEKGRKDINSGRIHTNEKVIALMRGLFKNHY